MLSGLILSGNLGPISRSSRELVSYYLGFFWASDEAQLQRLREDIWSAEVVAQMILYVVYYSMDLKDLDSNPSRLEGL